MSELNPILAELKGTSYLSTGDLSREQFEAMLDLAIAQKQGNASYGKPLDGKSVILLFFNPSLRTRTSMVVGVRQLGGDPVLLEIGKGVWNLEHREGIVMDGSNAEHIKEAIPVLASYADAIAVRCFPSMEDYENDKTEPVLSAFQQYSPVPILNMESATHHPMQGGADMLTIKEKLGSVAGRKVVLSWAYHPKALPMAVPNSFALASAQLGANLTLACPPEFVLDQSLMDDVKSRAEAAGGSFTVSHDLNEAATDAEVIYAKSWGSLQYYGRLDQEVEMRKAYKNWMISGDTMSRTNNGLFMHCLPVRRNVVVGDEVLDGPHSVVVDEAENRLHWQKTMMSVYLNNS